MENKYDLGQGVSFEVLPMQGWVRTSYVDGFQSTAWRKETPENRAEAEEQGYSGEAAVWRSLIEHELAHTILSRAIFGRESYVLRFESGAEKNRYAERLYEEALVLSFQLWLNTGRVERPLGLVCGSEDLYTIKGAMIA